MAACRLDRASVSLFSSTIICPRSSRFSDRAEITPAPCSINLLSSWPFPSTTLARFSTRLVTFSGSIPPR
jgi:hypothetical protein